MKIECITEVFVVDGGQIWRRGHRQHLHQRLLFDDLFQKTLYLGMPFDKQVAGLPQNFKAEPPSTPEGLNNAFATEFTRNVREVRQRVLGERPQLRQFSLCPRS